jgi:soluble lytic murein transglycosylase-like protein
MNSLSLTRHISAQRHQCAALLVMAWLGGWQSTHAQIYSGSDSSGALLLSNHASVESPSLLIDVEAATTPPEKVIRVFPKTLTIFKASHALAPAIRDAAQRHAISEALLTAVVAVESGFDPRAVSPKGAKGLMQLMPATAKRFGVEDVFAVQENLRGGAAYLSHLLAMFANDRSLALAAYNAGEGAVMRAGRRIPDYPETRNYVAKVLGFAGGTEDSSANAP